MSTSSSSVVAPSRPVTSLASVDPLRTGIYVYETSQVVIETLEDGLLLAQLGGPLDFAALGRTTTLMLRPGIYRVLSYQAISVTGNVAIHTAAGKDEWPDPDPKAQELLSDTITNTGVSAFFATKGIAV